MSGVHSGRPRGFGSPRTVRDGGGRIFHLARLVLPVAVGLSLALRAPWSAAAAAAAASGSGSVKLPGPGPGQCRGGHVAT